MSPQILLLDEPTKGLDAYFKRIFADVKSDLKKNGVTIYARFFADTYEEAVEGFNKLVRTRIRSLKDEIYKLEDMLIICNM